MNYELQGDYDGPYEKDLKTGIWNATTGPCEQSENKSVVPISRIHSISVKDFFSSE